MRPRHSGGTGPASVFADLVSVALIYILVSFAAESPGLFAIFVLGLVAILSLYWSISALCEAVGIPTELFISFIILIAFVLTFVYSRRGHKGCAENEEGGTEPSNSDDIDASETRV